MIDMYTGCVRSGLFDVLLVALGFERLYWGFCEEGSIEQLLEQWKGIVVCIVITLRRIRNDLSAA
jgi:hypothetical protein